MGFSKDLIIVVLQYSSSACLSSYWTLNQSKNFIRNTCLYSQICDGVHDKFECIAQIPKPNLNT